ncbi:hypothetical protein C5748_17130 [Phyllobacterium phragmitis]|uniref:Phage tail protein n=1 Tax=Phyllobacterium phragmitis TaxID=2670329 RepID=A0A2S9INT9_9HYPH|nr:pyocin knob domain-containing protein [Phyllobacterium phragmitis]PRD42188.1 hypothetical protein C5748_17130 [Phyllobacterium phragmitis]
MAIRPDWDVGTITLTAGQTAFTTSGSALLTAGVEAGDMIITPSGNALIIGATPTQQNAGVLFLPCPAAAAGTNMPLRIRFQPDGSRFQAAYRIVADLLDSGNLEALAALVGAADTLPYFTGPGAMDLTALTAFGRSLIGASNGGDAYSALGEVPGAQIPPRIGTITPGAADLNAITESGFYGADGGTLNRPGDAGNWVVLHMARVTTVHAQLAISRSNDNLANGIQYRFYNATSWSAWVSVFTQASIIGTVSQSGGVPTGALIERGSNANGTYTRYADGTQECIFVRDQSSENWNVASGGLFIGPLYFWTFPAAFSDGSPFVVGSTSRSGNEARGVTVRNVITSGANMYPWSSASITAGPSKLVTYYASGRWF